MSDRPSLPSLPGRLNATEDDVATLKRRVFTLERTVAELVATVAALSAQVNEA